MKAKAYRVDNNYVVKLILEPHKRTFLCGSNQTITHFLPRMHVEILFYPNSNSFALKYGFEIADNALCHSNLWNGFKCDCGTWVDHARQYLRKKRGYYYVNLTTKDDYIKAAKNILGAFLQTGFPNIPLSLNLYDVVDFDWNKISYSDINFNNEEIFNILSDDYNKLELAILFNKSNEVKKLCKNLQYPEAHVAFSIAIDKNKLDYIKLMLDNACKKDKKVFVYMLAIRSYNCSEEVFNYILDFLPNNTQAAKYNYFPYSIILKRVISHFNKTKSYNLVEKYREALGGHIKPILTDCLWHNPRIFRLIAQSVKDGYISKEEIKRFFNDQEDNLCATREMKKKASHYFYSELEKK